MAAIEHLGRAAQAVDANHLEVALGALLDAWRACRHERIADLVDVVSERVAAGRARPGGKKVEDKQRLWLAMAGGAPAVTIRAST